MMTRKYFIDNLRWICILTLIPFHSAMAWNTWESNYIWFGESKVVSSFVIFICSFYMPLLFVLAGMSMKYALKKRSNKQFLEERVKKLCIPLISGIMTVAAFMSYFAERYHNGYSKNFIQHYTIFFGKLGDFTGYDGKFTPAHLWFILYLFLVSIILLVVIIFQQKLAPNFNCRKIKMWQIIFLVIFPILFSFILDFGGKSIGESFALVALGYYVFSEDEAIDKLEKYRFLFLLITFIACCLYVLLFVWKEEQGAFCCVVLHEISQWCGVLGLIGLAKHNMNWNNKITMYLSRYSFPIYIFHFGWIVLIQFYLSKFTQNTFILYLSSIIGSLIGTLLTVELVRRVPVLRVLFGVKKMTVLPKSPLFQKLSEEEIEELIATKLEFIEETDEDLELLGVLPMDDDDFFSND